MISPVFLGRRALSFGKRGSIDFSARRGKNKDDDEKNERDDNADFTVPHERRASDGGGSSGSGGSFGGDGLVTSF